VNSSSTSTLADPVDLVVHGSDPVNRLVQEGKLVAGTRTDLVRSGIGVGVRVGAPKPDINSVEAFKRALLNAKSIGYLKVGSGVCLTTLLDRLGIAEAIAPKVIRPDADIVSQLVAKGEIELGMVVVTQILTTPGIELVGPLDGRGCPEWKNGEALPSGVGVAGMRARARQLGGTLEIRSRSIGTAVHIVIPIRHTTLLGSPASSYPLQTQMDA
jgi:hypothetical protein